MRITKIDDQQIVFDNGTAITFNHFQECCEKVYPDFVGSLSDNDIMDIDIEEINIEKVAGSGFRLNGYFVACYNKQEGNYNHELDLVITTNNDVRH